MNELLSRSVRNIQMGRGLEKGDLEHMLSPVVATVSQEFSEDLWKTEWEVSNAVLEDMEKERNDFYKRLNRVREEKCCREKAAEEGENSTREDEAQDSWAYLSDPEWAEVADRIHESEERDWPEEPEPISGKCILVTEKILPLKEEDPSLLIVNG
ncbi:pentatricopeptide repeat-containing protein [Salix suchowensis]|nr:pentatricopeptide repeat-containing protein [Salix suchowensis]